MSKFFVNKDSYKARLEVCRGCEHYFTPTGNCKVCGCFMRVKASISVMNCPIGKWEPPVEIYRQSEVPEHLIEEAKKIWGDIKTGIAKDIEIKKQAVELYNAIYEGGFKPTTNCSSCLNTVRLGIKKIIDET